MTTRNQLARLMAIHDKLSTGLHYSLSELMDACEARTGERPCEKTLYNDLRRLKEEPYNAPIPTRRKLEKPYWYTEKGFSLYAVLNPEDAAIATEAAALVKQLSEMPHFAGMEEVLFKFEQRAGVMGRAKDQTVQTEQNEGYTGLKWLRPLYEAMQQNCPLLLDYADFGDETATRYEVSPYLLREYNNRWFLFGRAEGWGQGRPFPLDRIEHLVLLPNKHRRPNETDWATEFTDVVGVTRIAENPVETLVVRVYLPRARYVETKPLHPSQTLLTRTETYIDFQCALRWNLELEAKLLEFGPDAELLSPELWRQGLGDKVRQMAARYGCYVETHICVCHASATLMRQHSV